MTTSATMLPMRLTGIPGLMMLNPAHIISKMILADTSLWIDYLDRGQPLLRSLLLQEEILIHPFVIGEFAMGTPKRRSQVLSDLSDLPQAIVAHQHEVMRLIEDEKLYGLGIGFVDAHLLASTRLTSQASLWTNDSRLHAAAQKLGVAYRPPKSLPVV